MHYVRALCWVLGTRWEGKLNLVPTLLELSLAGVTGTNQTSTQTNLKVHMRAFRSTAYSADRTISHQWTVREVRNASLSKAKTG